MAETAEPAPTTPAEAAGRDQSPRPSRQELVVPPRHSLWPVAIGAIASAAAGFGLVFALGIGRTPQPGGPVAEPLRDTVQESPAEPHAEPATGLAHDAPAVPAPLVPPAESVSIRPAASRWSSPIEPAAEPLLAPPADDGERFPARPVSHDEEPLPVTSDDPLPATSLEPLPTASDEPLPEADPEPVAPPADEPPLSRFSSPDLPPPDEPLYGSGFEPADSVAAETAAVDREPEPAPSPAPAPAAEPDIDASLAAGPDVTGPDAFPSTTVPVTEAEADMPVAADPPADDADFAAADSPAPEAADPAVSGVATAWSTPPAVGGAGEPSPVQPAADERPLSTTPPAFVATPPAAWPMADAAAEPSPQPAGPAGGPAPAAEGLPAPADLEAKGVPGPFQLEGVQTPQLAVEKRGPREIQVGKPARYEILVRNVGSATAHDVTLRDAVPRGTSLIATTPPASPAAEADGPPGDLVWSLGAMPPGGEARVVMELMPEEEGEIGSVASVRFRADATLRSRATKPALAIDAPPADPVRIGQDFEMSLTISNPGTGTATGVVLEAFLPETVSHRAGGELEFDVGQLKPGESKTIELVLGTRSPGSLPARFAARADGGVEFTAEMPLPVTAPSLELAIDMPARRFLQRPAACTISMTNSGTASARSVELAAQLPAGMKFVRANNAGWHDERTHRVLWNLEELPAGETGTVEMVVMPVEAGEQRITGAARSTDGPSDQAIHLCRVEGLAALAFQVADSEDPIEVEGVTEYVIRVANEGTKAASGVRLAALLLGDLEPVEVSGPGGHHVENLAVEFEPLARLAPGEDVVYRIRARGHRAGDQRVQVQLLSEDHPTPITKEEVTRVYDDR
jgi:uncharacterized repeat protein (TIGR01451 family)